MERKLASQQGIARLLSSGHNEKRYTTFALWTLAYEKKIKRITKFYQYNKVVIQ